MQVEWDEEEESLQDFIEPFQYGEVIRVKIGNLFWNSKIDIISSLSLQLDVWKVQQK